MSHPSPWARDSGPKPRPGRARQPRRVRILVGVLLAALPLALAFTLVEQRTRKADRPSDSFRLAGSPLAPASDPLPPTTLSLPMQTAPQSSLLPHPSSLISHPSPELRAQAQQLQARQQELQRAVAAFQQRLSQLPPLPVKRWSDLQKALTILRDAEARSQALRERAEAFQAETKRVAADWEAENGKWKMENGQPERRDTGRGTRNAGHGFPDSFLVLRPSSPSASNFQSPISNFQSLAALYRGTYYLGQMERQEKTFQAQLKVAAEVEKRNDPQALKAELEKLAQTIQRLDRAAAGAEQDLELKSLGKLRRTWQQWQQVNEKHIALCQAAAKYDVVQARFLAADLEKLQKPLQQAPPVKPEEIQRELKAWQQQHLGGLEKRMRDEG